MLLIGVGNPLRRDDGVGRWVAGRLRGLPGLEVREADGEGAQLMDLWRGASRVWLVDAVRCGAAPGTVHRLDAAASALPRGFFQYSSHAFALAEAVELARALGELPPRLVVYGIEGADFGWGEGLSPAVLAAAAGVVERLRGEWESSG